MVGDRVSLVQTQQRHEALAALGYYAGNLAAAWGPASDAALRAAQNALGVDVDGKWGPRTEDAIQQALASRNPCTTDECGAPGPAPTGRLRGVDTIGKFVIGAVAVTSVAVGIALWTREG